VKVFVRLAHTMARMMLKVLLLAIVMLAVDARSSRKNVKEANEYKAVKGALDCINAVNRCLKPISSYDSSKNPKPCDVYYAASDCLLVAISDPTVCKDVSSAALKIWSDQIRDFGKQRGCHK